MPKFIESYSMLISCPSDIVEFLPKIEEAVNGFNRGFGEQNGMRIETAHWFGSAYSSLEKGKTGQDVIDRQIVKRSDMMVGIFWTRFGTPTEKYGSGTEEEINLMLDAQKPVILFFLDKPISPSKINIDQLSRVRQFKDRLSAEKYGLYFTVEDEESLAAKLRNQLELCFNDILSAKKHPAAQNNGMTVLWVDDRPENNVYGRLILEQKGIEVITALSTEQALWWLENHDVAVVISDMGRKEGKDEGYVLLDQLRSQGNLTPYIIFAGSRRPEHVAETARHGGQGCTNRFDELIALVTSFISDTGKPF